MDIGSDRHCSVWCLPKTSQSEITGIELQLVDYVWAVSVTKYPRQPVELIEFIFSIQIAKTLTASVMKQPWCGPPFGEMIWELVRRKTPHAYDNSW